MEKRYFKNQYGQSNRGALQPINQLSSGPEKSEIPSPAHPMDDIVRVSPDN